MSDKLMIAMGKMINHTEDYNDVRLVADAYLDQQLELAALRRLLVAYHAAETADCHWTAREDHPELFEDGDQYLVAVRCGKNGGPYYLEYSVIRVHCDEGYFRITLDGDLWDCGWDDVEFYIPMSQFKLGARKEQP